MKVECPSRYATRGYSSLDEALAGCRSYVRAKDLTDWSAVHFEEALAYLVDTVRMLEHEQCAPEAQ